MKRTTLTLLATLAVAITMALSTAVAFAGFDYEDCPPASSSGFANASAQARANWLSVEPTTPPQATTGNPGNKYK